MNIFGYIYYRIARHILTMGRRIRTDAKTTLSAIQTSLIILWVIAPFKKAHSSNAILGSYNYAMIFSILLFIVLIAINFKLHVNKYEDYDRCWGNEDVWTRNLKGILVIAFLMSPLFSLWWLQYQAWF